MDVGDLRVFATVARHGSMNRAAGELNTVQSNVTAHIRALEQEIGVPLFERHARGVRMTPAGERMLPFVGRISKLLADAGVAARDDGAPRGRLTLGTMETTAALRLAPVLGAFAGAHPQVRLSLTTGTTGGLIAEVAEGRLDGAFVAGPVAHPSLQGEPVFREELVLVTAPALRAIADLAAIPDLKSIVFRLGCSYRQRLETLLAARGIMVAAPLEFGSIDAILACVAAGIGVTLLPRTVVAAAEARGEVAVHPLPPAQAVVDTLFIRRRDAYVSSALAAFLALVRTIPAGQG